MILLFLFLWLYYIDQPFTPEEEGIEVAFGDSEFEGAGSPDASSTPAPAPNVAPPAAEAPSTAASTAAAPSSNDLITSNEQTLALQKKREEDARKKAEAEAERKAKAAEEARIAAEKAAAEKAAAEKAAAEKAAADKASSLIGGAFSGSGSGTGGSGTGNQGGTGSGSGSTTKGNPAGKGTSNGYNWSLSGRSLKGSLSKPVYDANAEGTVVVQIRVNAAGQVISATKGQGTNTANQALIDAAINAAKQATFSPGDGDVIGSITYTFKLK